MMEAIETAYTFIVGWVMVFLLHELCHTLEAIRQGVSASIRVWKFGIIPSFVATVDDGNLKNPTLFALAGGLYSGILTLPFGIIAKLHGCDPFAFTFTTLAVMNICYSFFEAKYLFSMDRKKYMILHYIIYFTIFVIMLALWRGWG